MFTVSCADGPMAGHAFTFASDDAPRSQLCVYPGAFCWTLEAEPPRIAGMAPQGTYTRTGHALTWRADGDV